MLRLLPPVWLTRYTGVFPALVTVKSVKLARRPLTSPEKAASTLLGATVRTAASRLLRIAPMLMAHRASEPKLRGVRCTPPVVTLKKTGPEQSK